MPVAAPLLSVVIPAFNEAARLGETLCAVVRYLREYGPSQLIVVDDGSTDETAAVARHVLQAIGDVRARVIRYEENRGKGYALRRGLLAARAPIALFTDADLSTPIEEIPKLVDPIARGQYDVTFGSRALDRTLIGARQPFLRETGGRVFNRITRIATGMPFWDTQCGFKAFRMDAFAPVLRASTIDRFAFDVEWLYLAHRGGLRLREIAVRWNHHDGSKVSMRRDSLRMIQEIRLIRQRTAARVYDTALDEMRANRGFESAVSRRRRLDPRRAIA